MIVEKVSKKLQYLLISIQTDNEVEMMVPFDLVYLVTPIKEKYGQEVACFQIFIQEKKTKAQHHMIFEISKLFDD